MRSTRMRAAATVAALFALSALVGSAVFLAVREEDPVPTTTTTSTSTTTTIGDDDVIDAIAAALRADLAIGLTPDAARCIAGSLVAVVGRDRLDELVGATDPLSSLTPPERDLLVRGVVGCVPPEQAAAILGTPTTASPPVSLPDEDL